MKLTKRALAVLLALVLLCVCVPFAAAEDVTIVDSGTCGGNLTWTLDSEGTLLIDGTGKMYDYGFTGGTPEQSERTSAPWGYNYYNKIKVVAIGNGVTGLGSCAFCGCTELAKVTLGNSVSSIGNLAFFDCSALASVTISSSLTRVGEKAFRNCTSLESLVLPDDIEYIASDAFESYKAVKTGNNSSSVFYYYDTLLLCNKDTSTSTALTSLAFPFVCLDDSDDYLITEQVNEKLSYTINKRTRTLTIVNEGAMVSFASFTAPWQEYWKYITDVVILPGCTTVSNNAFQYCNSIKRVSLPNGIESLGSHAFDGCVSLTAINMPESVESIGKYAFQCCAMLKTIDLPERINTISASAFICSGLVSIVIPNNLTLIADEIFGCCYALENVTIGSSVISIGYGAFHDCSSLKTIIIPDNVKSLVTYAGSSQARYGIFYNCRSLKSVVIGDGATSIPYYAFYNCTALETIMIGNSVTSIGNYAFSGCSSLTSVTFGESVQTINEGAFSGCSSLATVVLPVSVTKLNSRAFPEKALKDIYIYSNNCSIAEDAIYYSATIHAYQGSTAETFANTNGYSFEPLTDAPAHEHDRTLVPGYAATCTESGLTDGYKCSVCGVWFQKQKEIKALGHDYQAVETVPATETETGYIRYECSRCDAGYTETLPVLTHEHSYSETERVNATCLEDGYVTYTCAGCGHSYTDLLPASGHSFGAWKTFLPTEAGQQGIDVRFCDVCGVYELRESESVSGGSTTPGEHTHSFVELERKEPDCENAGYVRAMCACGEGQVEVLAALGHDYQIGECVLETCTTAGYTPFVCTRCGNEIQTDLVPALGHLWNDGEVTAAPTCSAEGVTTYTCTREGCGETMEKTIPKDPDAHSFKVTTVAPTCVDAGYTSHACRYCRYGYTDEIVPALGHIDEDGDGVCDRCEQPLNHVFTNYVSDNNATCKEDGTKTAVCDICGIATDTIPDVGSHLFVAHQYEWTGMNDATCVANAHRKGVCKICGADVIEEIPDSELGHIEGDWVYPEGFDCEYGGNRYKKCTRCGIYLIAEEIEGRAHSEVIDPEVPRTCTTDGKSAGMHCERCGKVLVPQVIFKAEGHKADKNGFSVITAPTCTEDGLKTATCGVCGTEFNEVIPASGHTYTDLVVDPSCESGGYTLHKCTSCGDEVKDHIRDPLGHQVVIDPAVPATCQQSGKTEGSHCNRCGKKIVLQETIPMTDHTDANDDGVCDRCGTVLREPESQEEEPQGFFAKIGAFFRNLFDRIFGIFRR